MIKITDKQQLVLNALQNLGKGSVVGISKFMNSEIKSTYAHLRRLHKLGMIHIAEWGKSNSGHPLKVFKYGAGEDAVIDKKKHYDKVKQDNAKKRLIQTNTYDPFADIFKPRPDYAAAWLFHEPKVELLGARYE
jgi:chromosome condensin MukBEF MukE localization factor